ncbi:MAG: hypothetical protein V4679_16195 [Pseudomonadota bacterium]
MPSERATALEPLKTLIGDAPHGATGDAIDPPGPERARPGRGVNADEEEAARIEARLLAIGEAQVREMKAREAARKNRRPLNFDAPANAPRRWVIPRKYRVPVLLAVAYTVIGTVLGLSLGQRFMWFGEVAYGPLAWLLFLGLLPVFAAMWFIAARIAQAQEPRARSWAGRWLVVYPASVVLSACMVATAPWGWAALLGWTFGSPARVEVQVTSVEQRYASRGCNHSAKFELQGATSFSICLHRRLEGSMPPAGSTVDVSGKLSWLGLYVEQVHGR